jgi:hypothetical protein
MESMRRGDRSLGAQTKIVIDAPPETVFHVLTDPVLSKEWLKGSVETILAYGPLDRPGARFKQRFRQGQRWTEYEGHLTEYIPGRVFAAEINNGPFVSRGKYEVEPHDQKTMLSFSIHFEGRTFGGRLLCIPLGLMAKVMCRTQVNELKIFVEKKRREGQL